MIINRITEGMANTLLRQMGAVEIKNAPAYVNKVKFKLDEDTNATYIYEIKENEVIYLNRVRPYALYLGECADEQELVSAIRQDLEMMKEAQVSPHFKQYLSIMQKMQGLRKRTEHLFMNVSTSEYSMDRLEELLDLLGHEIDRLGREGTDMDLKTYADTLRAGETEEIAHKKAEEAAESAELAQETAKKEPAKTSQEEK